ncbi:MAG: ABC transporter ATP-binding protein [Alphaproteobacteria bacterium]|nr:ABC transporter ATP-binding protein [Alphaproteobacteria bacterium]
MKISSVPKTTSFFLMRRLWREHVTRYRKQLLIAVGCMITVAATSALDAWIMQPVLDKIFLEQDRTMLVVIPIVVVVLSIVRGAASYGQFSTMRHLGQRIISDLQLRLYGHLIRADLALFHDQGSGKLISRFTNDISMMRETLTNLLTGLAKEAFTLVFLVGVMFYQSAELALIAFVLIPVAILPILKLGRRMRKLSDQTQEQLGQFTQHLDQTFSAARVIKAYGTEAQEISRAEHMVETIFGVYSKGFKVKSAASPMMEALGGIAVAAVVWYGGWQVIEGETTPGAFFSFITAMLMAYKPLKSMAGINTTTQEGLAAAARVFAALDAQSQVRDAEHAKALAVQGGQIRFDQVVFRYPGDEREALSGITLDVPAGKTVALVGASGGGKSTVMNLLLRFYDVGAGRITIDGQDIAQVTQRSLRETCALVSQDTLLFDDTVRANICYGHALATDGEIVKAATDAAAHEFIVTLPQGYDTRVGAGGVNLSGGQRQRIAIARAMLRNAPILLLDEATSALDPVSEQQVQEALERLKKGRTTLVIAHRLSTVINADIIYVIKHGKVVESGRHKDLLEKGGEYSELYSHQFKDDEEKTA